MVKRDRMRTLASRKIAGNMARFLSLVLLNALAVAFLAGLITTSPDMRHTADGYYDRQDLFDVRFAGNLGLTEEDFAAIAALPGVKKAEGVRTADAALGSKTLTVISLPAAISLPELTSGRLPEAADELVTEQALLDVLGLSIGDKVTLSTEAADEDSADTEFASFEEDKDGEEAEGEDEEDEDEEESVLANHTFTVVGTVRSPLYITADRGTSSIGNGSVDAYCYVLPENFTADYYTSVDVTLEGLKELECYIDGTYDDSVEDFIDAHEAMAKERAKARHEAVVSEAEEKLQDARETLAEKRAEVDGELSDAEDMLTLLKGSFIMADEYEKALAEYEDGKKEADEKFAEAEELIAEAEEDLADLPAGKWYVYGRDILSSYRTFSEDSQRMSNLANVFPLVFFLVAALSCLTTMTRMVEDGREEIGALKAMGFSDAAIAWPYIGYAFRASFIGAIAGLVIGLITIPVVIYSQWQKALYALPDLSYLFQPVMPAVSVIAAVLVTTGTATAACVKTLREVPAELMRPRAPKAGKRVFLEYLPFVWNRLGFIGKVTMRNIFRYKKRFFMAVAGIAGCSALLVTSIGLHDSIFDILEKHYGGVVHYDATAAMDLEDTDAPAVIGKLSAIEGVEAASAVSQTYVSAARAGEAREFSGVTMTVVTDPADLDGFITLRERGKGPDGVGESLPLTAEGAIIDEKLSELMEVTVGDRISYIDGDDVRTDVTVTGICEGYMGHQLVMTTAGVAAEGAEVPEMTEALVVLEEGADSEKVGEKVMALDEITAFSRVDTLKVSFRSSMSSIDAVFFIIVLAAAALAFIVLFNLMNINITERRRELATLKVLGFFPGEQSAYVVRENMILTLIGALVGLALGRILHMWFIGTIETDQMMMGRYVRLHSYVFAVAMTMIFSVAVNLFGGRLLKKIDMVESLKTVE